MIEIEKISVSPEALTLKKQSIEKNIGKVLIEQEQKFERTDL